MKQNKCLRCEYEWASMLERRAKVCPRCKSYSWDIERKNIYLKKVKWAK